MREDSDIRSRQRQAPRFDAGAMNVLCVIVALLCLVDSSWSADKLNVLFIAVDDMRTTLGCYGDQWAKSPNIDRLATRGLLFKRAYCQQAVCHPSRASLITGLRPDTLKIWDLRKPFRRDHPNVVTLPQTFMRHGYHAQCIGKVLHNGPPGPDRASWSVPSIFHRDSHYRDFVLPDGKRPQRKGPAVQRVDVPDSAYWDGQIADKAIEALRKIKDRPFFLAVGFWKPHLPFAVPDKYWSMYDPKRLAPLTDPNPPRDVPKIALHENRELRGYTDVPTNGRIDIKKVEELRHGYYAAVSYVDAQVGKVIDELDRLKLADRTIIVFWSDHGFHLGEHGLWCKVTNFELDTRVPLIIATPGAKAAGKSTDALVELVDLYPTLVELCGMALGEGLEGVDLHRHAPLLQKRHNGVDRRILTGATRRALVLHDGRSKALEAGLRYRCLDSR